MKTLFMKESYVLLSILLKVAKIDKKRNKPIELHKFSKIHSYRKYLEFEDPTLQTAAQIHFRSFFLRFTG